jgi:hypothetical protein
LKWPPGRGQNSGGTKASARNPIASFGLTIIGTLILSFLIGIPTLFILPQPELVYFYLPFALFAVGMVAGRTTFLGTLGFIGATVGGFIGIYAFEILFVPPWPTWPGAFQALLTMGFAAACGLGGLASGKLGLRRIERENASAPKMRRCLKCGVKVGISARKCWSCRSSLPRT